jgi:hypothetical protein
LETLADWIRQRGPLAPPDAVGWAIRLAKHVESLHEHGVAHGNVSPACVLMGSANPRTKGLMSDVRKTTESLPYHSPERVIGGQLSPPDDAWAIAATLYTALTAAPPFVGATDQELQQAVLRGAPTPLSAYGLQDAGLERLFAGTFAPDPSRRLSNVSQLRQELERWHPQPQGLEPLDDEEPGDEDNNATAMLNMMADDDPVTSSESGRGIFAPPSFQTDSRPKPQAPTDPSALAAPAEQDATVMRALPAHIMAMAARAASGSSPPPAPQQVPPQPAIPPQAPAMQVQGMQAQGMQAAPPSSPMQRPQGFAPQQPFAPPAAPPSRPQAARPPVPPPAMNENEGDATRIAPAPDLAAVFRNAGVGGAMPPPGMGPPGMQPPGMGPPGMQPPGMGPPGMQPPGMQPPGMQPPGMQPPGMQPPGMQPPAMQPTGGAPGATPPPRGSQPGAFGAPPQPQPRPGFQVPPAPGTVESVRPPDPDDVRTVMHQGDQIAALLAQGPSKPPQRPQAAPPARPVAPAAPPPAVHDDDDEDDGARTVMRDSPMLTAEMMNRLPAKPSQMEPTQAEARWQPAAPPAANAPQSPLASQPAFARAQGPAGFPPPAGPAQAEPTSHLGPQPLGPSPLAAGGPSLGGGLGGLIAEALEAAPPVAQPDPAQSPPGGALAASLGLSAPPPQPLGGLGGPAGLGSVGAAFPTPPQGFPQSSGAGLASPPALAGDVAPTGYPVGAGISGDVAPEPKKKRGVGGLIVVCLLVLVLAAAVTFILLKYRAKLGIPLHF